jgi:hypothetical protein
MVRMPDPITVLTMVVVDRRKSVWGGRTRFRRLEGAGEDALLSVFVSAEFVRQQSGLFVGLGRDQTVVLIFSYDPLACHLSYSK